MKCDEESCFSLDISVLEVPLRLVLWWPDFSALDCIEQAVIWLPIGLRLGSLAIRFCLVTPFVEVATCVGWDGWWFCQPAPGNFQESIHQNLVNDRVGDSDTLLRVDGSVNESI